MSGFVHSIGFGSIGSIDCGYDGTYGVNMNFLSSCCGKVTSRDLFTENTKAVLFVVNWYRIYSLILMNDHDHVGIGMY